MPTPPPLCSLRGGKKKTADVLKDHPSPNLNNVHTLPPHLYKLRQCTQLLRSLRLLYLGQGRGLRATHTTADTHVRRPHVLKWAIQDLWDASDLKKKFLVHQQGAT